MRYRVRLLTIIPALALLFFASCAPIETPPQDPTKEQLTLLQKQLLELQKIQIDTKTKLDEIDALTERLKTLEERQHIRRAAPPEPTIESAPADTEKIEPRKKPTPVKKKPIKKKAKKKRKPSKTQQPITQQPQPQQPARTQ